MRMKKIKKVAPLAVLSTAVLLSPTYSFAAEQPTGQSITNMNIHNLAGQTSNLAVDEKTIKDDMVKRIFETEKTGNSIIDGVKKVLLIETVANWTPQFTNVSNKISISNVNIDSFTTDNIELASYKNETSEKQELVTDEKTESVTSSFTNTDTNSEKLGLDTETKVDVEIPFVADGGETIKTTTEFTFTQSSSNTETNTTSVKYPSQKLVCAPGYITSLIVVTSKADFSGTMDIDGKIANLDQLGIKTASSNQDLYNIYKQTSDKIPLPAGVTVDDANHTVKYNRSMSFNGVGGHLTNAEATQVKIESLDRSKKPVIMSLQQYQDPTVRENILKQNQ
ncbi:hypothetical protein CN602_29330 [Bacillus cereus]|uniref:ETX/MTX2 family pore-forming toxin n=1 Tax=Bacillus cereus TaxID=1396 RepID=UPI000BEF4099|nr:ETX/MTX2 family pore-forming toxin [Bacillus cereus]PEL94410.1 hypothetical protein CN602_29330 [Bacillus cereus]